MISNSSMLNYGAPLNTAFRSQLNPGAMLKHFKPPAPLEPDDLTPRPPELWDLTRAGYDQKELGALAKYFSQGRR